MLAGAMNMEIARRYAAPQFISRAASSLRKAQQKSQATVPIVSLLLAQAEGSLGSKAKWEKNLRLEWFSWPPGMKLNLRASKNILLKKNRFLFYRFLIFIRTELRPAELYFQMHLLASQLTAATAPQQKQQLLLPETMQSPGAWLLRAIHQNPSCPRYLKALEQLVYV
jgi:superkiller protein 3